jgi:hypothetical protein
VANQCNAFKITIDVATTIKGAAVEWTHQAVIADQTHHCYRVKWTLAQELKNFRF